MLKVLSIFGTRPEAIKMAPVVVELSRHHSRIQSIVCVTAQHRQMLDQVLNLFDIQPDYDLNVMKQGQDLFDITTAVLQGIKSVLAKEQPDMVLVHGDTTTSMAAALAAYYYRIPVAHIEAGLRTHNKYAPFPEEVNRRVAGVLADIHFAPTETARHNLLNEGVPSESIHVTGNTVVDALSLVSTRISEDRIVQGELARRFFFLDSSKRLILVTGHRRENFGSGFENICRALAEIAVRFPGVELLYPIHLNPDVREPVRRLLGDGRHSNVHLVEPVDYLSFVYLMQRAHIIITDSGGIQEEAAALGKPVLLMRETTERPEAVDAGTTRLVGANRATIVAESGKLILNANDHAAMCQQGNIYGDGRAARRIVQLLIAHISVTGLPQSVEPPSK